MGMIVPIMGTKKTSGLADALFTKTQQRVLGALFGQPDRSFYARELIALTGAGSGAVQRELARLERSRLVLSERRGAQKHYRANPASPLFGELGAIAHKTFALAEPLRQALAPLASQIRAAFVFGSVAKREDTARSDIDLMVVSESLGIAELIEVLFPIEPKLGRPVNPITLTSAEYTQRRKDGSFVHRVSEQPKLWILGGEDDLPA